MNEKTLEEAKQFIKESFRRGYSEETIAEAFLKANYKEQDIVLVFHSYNQDQVEKKRNNKTRRVTIRLNESDFNLVADNPSQKIRLAIQKTFGENESNIL